MKWKTGVYYAFTRSLPVMCGYIFLGIAFGILLQQSGYHAVWALAMSLFVYAGSLQFVMVPLLTAAVSPLAMAVTTLFVNCRHLFYGLSFVESFRRMKTRCYMIFSMTDETYSVLCGCKSEDPEEKYRDFWFLIALFDQAYWVIGSVIGSLLGQILPFDFTGIDFSMTALFTVILLEQVCSVSAGSVSSAAIGLIAGTVCLFLFGADRFLLPAMLAAVLCVAFSAGVSGDKKGLTS